MLAHYIPINYRMVVSYKKKSAGKSTTLGILLNLTFLGPDQLDYVFNPTEHEACHIFITSRLSENCVIWQGDHSWYVWFRIMHNCTIDLIPIFLLQHISRGTDGLINRQTDTQTDVFILSMIYHCNPQDQAYPSLQKKVGQFFLSEDPPQFQ